MTRSGSSSEKPSRRVGKSHRKDGALGRKTSLLARMPAYERGVELRHQVEICHFSKHKTGRNLSRISSACRSDRVTFSNSVPGRKTSLLRLGVRGSEFVTVRGKSAGRNSSPLGIGAADRKMSPLDRPWVGNRHHCAAATYFVLAVCRKH